MPPNILVDPVEILSKTVRARSGSLSLLTDAAATQHVRTLTILHTLCTLRFLAIMSVQCLL